MEEQAGQEAPQEPVQEVTETPEVAEQLQEALQEEYVAPEPGPDSDYEDAAPETASEPADEWDAPTLEQAKFYGFTEDEAKAYGSKDLFEKTILALDKQASQFGRQVLEQSAAEQPVAQPRDEQGRFVPKQEPAPQAPPSDGDFDISKILADKDWDEDTVSVLTQLDKHYGGTNKQLREALAQQEQLLFAIGQKILQDSGQLQADDSQKFESDMDSFFDGLGDEFKQTFGAGPVGHLSPTGTELVERNKLVEEMQVLAIADERASRPRQDHKTLAQRALRSLHYDKLKATARKEVVNKVAERKGQAIHRASGHNGKAPSKRDAALARVEDFYRTKGYQLSDLGDDDPEV